MAFPPCQCISPAQPRVGFPVRAHSDGEQARQLTGSASVHTNRIRIPGLFTREICPIGSRAVTKKGLPSPAQEVGPSGTLRAYSLYQVANTSHKHQLILDLAGIDETLHPCT